MGWRSFLGGLAAILLLAAAGPAQAYQVKVGPIVVADPWTPATLRANLGNAVYMIITNTGTAPVTLTGASTPAARGATLHQTVVPDDGIARMIRVIEVEILPNEELWLEPQALHIMLTTLGAPLVKDQTVPLTLTFKELSPVTVDVMVEAANAREPRERPNP